MQNVKYKYGVFYTDGGYRDRQPQVGAGLGIHGYVFNELTSTRYAKVPAQVTPYGYEAKLSGIQLKDDAFNPTYTQWDVSVKAKDGTVMKAGADIKLIDAWGALGAETSQRGELQAFIKLFECEELQVEYYTIHSDSNYLVNGVKRDLVNWKKNNWLKSNGQPVINRDLWEKIDTIVAQYEGRYDLRKIKAHDGNLGNEAADRNASMAVASACNGYDGLYWAVSDIHDIDYWAPEKPLPILLQQKWNYTFSGHERSATIIDSEVYWEYFMGDHDKSKDDVELLGKNLSGAGFSFILNKEKSEILETVLSHHTEHMWDNEPLMYRSELMIMVNCANLGKPKNTWELTYGKPQYLFLGNQRNDLNAAKTEDLLSRVIRPPRVSYRIADVEDELKQIVRAYICTQGRTLDELPDHIPQQITVNEVTDRFFTPTKNKAGEVNGVKVSDEYSQITTSMTFDVNHPYNDKKAKVIATRSVDLPSRTILSKSVGLNPKVYVVTWVFDGIMIKFGVLLETDEGIGLWSGYASTRILNKEEQ